MRQYTENDDKILTDTKEDAQEKTLERLNKIFFYHIPFVSTANNKLLNSKRSIPFHNMPQNWSFPYFNHRLRLSPGLLADTAS